MNEIVLSDSSKPDMIFEVVSDWNLSSETKQKYEQLGYNLVEVKQSANIS